MIPLVTVNNLHEIYTGLLNRNGSMCNAYSPFKNLSTFDKDLGNFTTELLNFDLSHPVDIIPQDSYDGSVNLILNDGKNLPRLIGSRFSVIDDKLFKITDHAGFKDTNIYEEDTFDIDTSLKTIAQKIPVVEFEKITQFGGSLPCGAYTFYFKLADADGNESEVLAESGLVLLFIGGLAGDSSISDIQPDSMRMGLEDESTGKSITFKVTNIDSGFDYIHVLYARSSSSNDLASIDTYHKIVFDYPIVDGEATITITGNEQIIGISAEELYVDYADLEVVKTQAVVNNVLFFGNLVKKERDWEALRKASWKIIPSWGQKNNVGSIDIRYNVGGTGSKDTGVYYNPYNVYYRVGYWPDEIYRFGVVYIFDDNSLSPVFNIPGVDFNKTDKLELKDLFKKAGPNDSGDNDTYFEWEAEPDDFYFNKEKRINSRGVIKFKNAPVFSVSDSVLLPKPIYISFDVSNMAQNDLDDRTNHFTEFIEKHKIKGMFFVRQKRIPTILGLGLAIGLTGKDYGALPIILHSGLYTVLSFLNTHLLILPEGEYVSTLAKPSINALLFPEAELCEATYNQLFVSNKYSLIDSYTTAFTGDNDSFEYSYYSSFSSNINKKSKRKLTNIPEDIKTLTDGEIYFSTLAGNPDEPYKTADVKNKWNETPPQDLTRSTTLVRGKWGPFVGVGEKEATDNKDLKYGHIYTIKSENYIDDEELATDLDFLKRFNSAEFYSAICDRTEIKNTTTFNCYRGDCFISLFTHRMFRNFIDPELPTNDKIINPMCWAQNYAVRCTAIADVSLHNNLKSDNAGWVVGRNNLEVFANEITLAFEIRENENKDGVYEWDSNKQEWYIEGDEGKKYCGTAIVGGALSVNSYLGTPSLINIVKPAEQEQGIGGVLKNIFKSNKWALRGLASINRADVNAVGLGQWITFPICSSKNLSLRDIDYSNATEQATFNRKRSFYPLTKIDIHNPLRDSNVINQATGISLPHKHYYGMPNVPFIKQEYFTRVINSLRDSANSVTNEFKVMLESAYRDYTKIHGSITKLMPLASKMLVVFEHGLGVLALNDQMSLAENALGYLPAELNMVVSPTYGSMWKDSIIEASGYIYGVDSVAKVIWRVNSECQLEIISQMKIEKFLIDNIDMSEFSNKPYVGHINIKAHYNAFKHDVIFTYYNDILYKFDSSTPGDKSLSEWKISSDGYLLNDDGSLYLEDNNPIKGEKVVPEYDEESGKVKTYFDALQDNPKTTKWANGKSWSICFNELIGKFVTFYDWIPLESENIDNIWFSFDREASNKLAAKGFSGELPKLTSPSTSNGLLEEDFAKHIIDSSFNNTCNITHYKNSCQFDLEIEENELVYTYGFYLSPKRDYTVSLQNSRGVSLDSRDIPVENKEEDTVWKLVVVKVLKNNTNVPGKLSIVIETTDGSSERFAVTDLISKQVADPDVEKSYPAQVLWIDPSEYNHYYYIRDLEASLPLWKHGLAGIYDNAEDIKPTYWYGKQHEFNFEFIARLDAIHKVFNNLLIISNKAEPHKFEFEVVGEVYDWHKYKPVLKWIADSIDVATDNPEYTDKLNAKFVEVLTHLYKELRDPKLYQGFPRIFGMKDGDYFEKLPYLKVTDACVPTLDPEIIGEKKGTKDESLYLPPEWYTPQEGDAYADNTVDCCLVYDKQLNEFRVHTEQLGNDMWKYGRLRGNMQYLEDLWRIEIRPISFKYAYVPYTIVDGNRVYTPEYADEELTKPIPSLTKVQETRHRDKYIKVKVRYTGEDLAVIQAISTIFDYSYA